MYSISGEVIGSRSRASPSISSAICERVDALADQRLVDVEVEEPHLRLGDLADRLRVDPDELQQRDEREPGLQHVADPLHRDDVLLVERPLERGRGPQQRHHPLDQRLLEPGALGRLAAGERRAPGPGSRSST